ncbi:MAG: replication-associated recombination protein A [Spirochaetes bacterium]|nr:replication-associated recombination protein A [Spirochaetota bacterium]
MGTLFENNSEKREPLAKRLAPDSLDGFYGQQKIVGKEGVLRSLILNDRMTSSIFFGPSGCGKTALARVIAALTKSEIIRLNAVTSRVEDLRTAFFEAKKNRAVGMRTILFIDEIHRFNKLQQDGLLPALEEGTVTLIGTTTRNPFYALIPPLRSRVLLFEFEPLDRLSLACILKRAEESESISIDSTANEWLLRFANGDARRMLNLLEAVIQYCGRDTVSQADISRVIDSQPLLYDRDEDYHYDTISAFIKSIRGSDPDAAVYWLALMLEAGEDPLYIARRLVILASEDIGLADAHALPLALAGYDAVERIGMPESRIILSHVALYLSLQPKSNSSYTAIEAAGEHVTQHETLPVPPHLRSSVSHKEGYRYPHDYPYHWTEQEYLGIDLKFYIPGGLGDEKQLKKRLEFLRNLERKEKISGDEAGNENIE